MGAEVEILKMFAGVGALFLFLWGVSTMLEAAFGGEEDD